MSLKSIRNHMLLALLAVQLAGYFGHSSAIAAKIDDTRSTLAIVTDKEGLASALAHRHIIVASKWSSKLDLKLNGAGIVESGIAFISIPVAELIVDHRLPIERKAEA